MITTIPHRLKAPAKINLSLRILGKRPDGYHELTTRMAPLELHDVVTLERLDDGDEVLLTCSDPTIPIGEDNLIVKAYRALAEATGRTARWRVHLEKHIPSGAGLGGGSSDAAAAIAGINVREKLNLTLSEQAGIAAKVGSDVPFFLFNSVCDASGRGEKIQPIPFPWTLNVLLIKPPFGIATPWAYQSWAKMSERERSATDGHNCPWGEMVNDLERPVFQKHLLLPALKSWLLEQQGVQTAMMSGSGSTVYAVLADDCDTSSIAERTAEFCGPDAWIKLTRTIPS